MKWCIPNSKWHTLCPRINPRVPANAFLQISSSCFAKLTSPSPFLLVTHFLPSVIFTCKDIKRKPPRPLFFQYVDTAIIIGEQCVFCFYSVSCLYLHGLTVSLCALSRKNEFRFFKGKDSMSATHHSLR